MRKPTAWLRFVPSVCPFCRAWPVYNGPSGICADCLRRYAHAQPRCLRCALAVTSGQPICGQCLLKPPPLETCFAAVDYAYPWHDAVHALKFNQKPAWARGMASICLQQHAIAAFVKEVDCILAIPLSPLRLRERGYNQAYELAHHLAHQAQHSSKLIRIALTRTESTTHQAHLSRTERWRHLQNAFHVVPSASPLIRGKSVLLVDDVMTTGATLHAAASTLLKAGAHSVSALVFARTAAPAMAATSQRTSPATKKTSGL